MAAARASTGAWRRLGGVAFSLRHTLFSGQVFRWRDVTAEADNSSADEFIGVVRRCVVHLRQEHGRGGGLTYRVLHGGDADTLLPDHFNTGVDVAALQRRWVRKPAGGDDERCEALADQMRRVACGEKVPLRVLRQDPEECLMSFICSQNNNVARIRSMIDALCVEYGTVLSTVDGHVYHSFPTSAELLRDGEASLVAKLGELGFGYRAKYIAGTAKQLRERRICLASLRDAEQCSYDDVIAVLTSLPGVGRKVADCVALFSLDRHHVVAVDTHILRLSKELLADRIDFKKSLTPTVYDAIQRAYVATFGPHAGWAHSVMFHAELVGSASSTRTRAKAEKKTEKTQPPAAKKRRVSK